MTAATAIIVLKREYKFPILLGSVISESTFADFEGIICRPRLGTHADTRKIDSDLLEVLAVDVGGVAYTFCIQKPDIDMFIWCHGSNDPTPVADALALPGGFADLRDVDIGASDGSADYPEIPLYAASAPAATTPTDLYTCPASKTAVIETLYITNRGAATTFRVSKAPAGAVVDNSQYKYYDTPIDANETLKLDNLSMRLSETDVVRVYAGSANLTFSAEGLEFTR